ncbi:hypothetical protein PLEOSDRAFT_159574 [Pleurotus ostreatus PC15]|uniref:Protein kinase domain-containing protein n=1 Tax=Pleurotus ostreatus (strain PC15) TaxID=1137138 RepID=A0A067NF85_PLEO1|nr:hypothetical protein PLEOSDRAFT_159574 [Pleurotus ostreatus PC15]
MSDTWDEPELKLLEERKDWILAEPQLKPVRHALPLWDHIKLEGLNDDISAVVEVGAKVGRIYHGELKIGETTTKIAIKVCYRNTRHGEKVADHAHRLAREIKIWRLLRHPNIVPYLGILGMTNARGHRTMGIASPLCEGGDIMVFVAAHPDQLRLPLCLNVAEGLEYLHRYGIAHGDVKPANIIVQVSEHGASALVCDFDTAVIIGDEECGNPNKRTLRYLAPEFGSPGLIDYPFTKESDVFSFAFTVLEIVSGKLPFFDIEKDGHISYVAVPSGERPDRTAYPCSEMRDNLWGLLERCWVGSPGERCTMSAAVLQLRLLTDETH